MAHDPKKAKPEREPVYDDKEDIHRDDRVDEACEQLLRRNSVFLHEFRQIIQSRSYVHKTRVLATLPPLLPGPQIPITVL